VVLKPRLSRLTGKSCGKGNYYEKQRPMTEDFMGFIQRHGVFVTAEELAIYGVARLYRSNEIQEHMINPIDRQFLRRDKHPMPLNESHKSLPSSALLLVVIPFHRTCPSAATTLLQNPPLPGGWLQSDLRLVS